MRYTFSYGERLHRDKEFRQILKSGRRMAHPAILIYIYTRGETGAPRLGLVTSRKLGSAPKRNRLKRRLREVFRLHKHLLKRGLDIVFIPGKPAVDMAYRQLEDIIMGQLSKAGMAA